MRRCNTIDSILQSGCEELTKLHRQAAGISLNMEEHISGSYQIFEQSLDCYSLFEH